MVTSATNVLTEIPSDKAQQGELSDNISNKDLAEVQQRRSLDMGPPASQSSQDGSELTMVVEKVSSSSQLEKDPESESHLSQCSQEIIPESLIPKDEIDNLHEKTSHDSGVHTLQQCNQERDLVHVKHGDELNNLHERQSPDSGIRSFNSSLEDKTISVVTEKESYTLLKTHDGSQSYQNKFTLSVRTEKVLDKLPLRRNPDGVQAGQSDPGGVNLSRIPEKPLEDGYNWRKYGQKLVRGNTFIRSYYKCTFSDCRARKQVERSHDGPITEINYLWQHEHPKPVNTLLKGTAFVIPIQARRPDEQPSSTISEDESSVHGETSQLTETTETSQLAIVPASSQIVEVAVSQSSEVKSEVNNDGDRDSKRQKREVPMVSDTFVTKTNCEPRVVVQTTSVVDIVNDGYRWRKYGQKLVKGNSNPRSYYRCSTTGCPVKKHVERAAHDPKVVITTYEGQHDHGIPGGNRTVTHNTDASTTSHNGAESNEAIGMDVVVHVGAD